MPVLHERTPGGGGQQQQPQPQQYEAVPNAAQKRYSCPVYFANGEPPYNVATPSVTPVGGAHASGTHSDMFFFIVGKDRGTLFPVS